MNGSPTPKVAVSVPARPDFLHLLRSVVASVAARLDLPYDDIDDLTIAVDEACSQLLSAAAGASTLTLGVHWSAAGVEVVVATDGGGPSWPPAGYRETLAWRVLTAVTDEASFDDGPAVRFRKQVEGAPGA